MAPPPGRRATWGGLLLLVVYLFTAPPLFLLGPLAALLLLGRPATGRELAWLVLALAGCALAFFGPGDPGIELMRTAGLLYTAAFAGLGIGRGLPAFRRSGWAAAIASGGVVLWAMEQGLSLVTLETTVRTVLESQYRQLLGPGVDPEVAQTLLAGAAPFAAAFPAVLALLAMAGGVLACGWYARFTARQQAPALFREFRFNDHLVWAALAAFGAVLMPLQPGWHAAALNVLVVWAALYAVRGLAIVSWYLAAAAIGLRLLLALGALFLLPFATGALLALGLADTWLDLRRRPSPPIPGGIPS